MKIKFRNRKLIIATTLIVGMITGLLCFNGGFASSPQTPVLNQNASGQTYGQHVQGDKQPDLISARSDDGTLGYVYASDLYGAPKLTPEEIGAQQKSGKLDSLNVYSSDGKTIIGHLTESKGDYSTIKSDGTKVEYKADGTVVESTPSQATK